MPGTLTDEIQVVDAGHGGGTGVPPGGDDGGEGGGRAVPRQAYFTGIQLGLAGIVMFFMALASSFLVRKGIGGDWLPFAFPRILWVNTAILLASSATVHLARRELHRGALAGFRQWWTLTMGLGALFVAGQLLAWRELASQGVFLATNPSSSFFYVLTASHGLHLLGGLLALAYVAWRRRERSRVSRETAADLAAIYWHFMDVLWVFLFALLYWGR